MDRVHAVTRDVLPALGQVRFAEQQSLGEPAALHRQLRTLLNDAMHRASALGFSQNDVDDIGYVLAALADEVVLLKGHELRDFWLGHQLQLELFNTATAGEGVFERLEVLVSDPSRVEVLEVYSLALLFGFQGKYGVRGGESELLATHERVEEAIRRSGRRPETGFSPHGGRPSVGGQAAQMDRSLFRAAVGALGVALLVYLVMALSLSWRTGDVSETLHTLGTELN